MSYSVEDVILYVVCRLGGVHGIRKLMYLLFLVQYESKHFLFRRRVVKYMCCGDPIAHANFYIWTRGPHSNEIETAVESLINRGKLMYDCDEYGRTIIKCCDNDFVMNARLIPLLPDRVIDRLDRVINKYGNFMPTKLEHYILRKVLLMEYPAEKEDYIGMLVDEYFLTRRISVKTVDVCCQ